MEYDNLVTNVRFNQDKSCFVCCMHNGLRIYYVDPLVEKVHYDEEILGSVGFCEMIYRCNLFAVVSGGDRPKFAENSILVFDDVEKKAVLEFTFNQKVMSVRCRKDMLVAVLKTQIHIFSFPTNPKKIFTVDTRNNPLGLCELSPGAANKFLVFPGFKSGCLQIMDLTAIEPKSSSSPKPIRAHEGELACLSMNQQGDLVATASNKGTLIRVWNLRKGICIRELRRGSDPAIVYSINFSQNSDFLCCSSDKGTIHIFALKDSHLNRRSALSKIGVLGNYGESQWALARFNILTECACICAFSSSNSVVAICVDGTFHKYVFNSDGNGSRLAYDVYLDICCDEEY